MPHAAGVVLVAHDDQHVELALGGQLLGRGKQAVVRMDLNAENMKAVLDTKGRSIKGLAVRDGKMYLTLPGPGPAEPPAKAAPKKAPKAAPLEVKAVSSLLQMMLDVERDADVLQDMYRLYHALGLPVHQGELGIEAGSDEDLLAVGKELSPKMGVCRAISRHSRLAGSKAHSPACCQTLML
jgi:hypothetical protein